MEEVTNNISEPVPKNDDSPSAQGKSCALCGCSTPAVRCDRCNSQIFCLSCDDMYHKHPKRRLHLRKAVDSIWNSVRSPRLRKHTDLPLDPSKIPIPPPRSKKRERHTIGGRIFLKSGHELGSFGHSKVFDLKDIAPSQKEFYLRQNSPANGMDLGGENGRLSHNENMPDAVYENENIANQSENMDMSNTVDRSPWNTPRPNMSSPIQVSIPSGSPEFVSNGQQLAYPVKPQSHSVADLPGASTHPIGQHPYHYSHPYPYMHPPMHPPYSHSMAHLNCAQCLSSSWSNLMSPHPSPYFHPMPWGSTVPRGPHMVMSNGQVKHSHGDLISYPDPNFQYPYHGAPVYPNGPPVVDPNFVKDLHEQAEAAKAKKNTQPSEENPSSEGVEAAANPDETQEDRSEAVNGQEATAAVQQVVEDTEDKPVVPVKPTEPWECVHCTFINPPGDYICQVCCRTSYGNIPSKPSEAQEDDQMDESREIESPELINRDAIMSSPEASEKKDTQQTFSDGDTGEKDGSPAKSGEDSANLSSTESAAVLTTETQTSFTMKTTDVQTQNLGFKSIASSTDSIFTKQEMSVQTDVAALIQNCSVATDPMISSHSMESLLSGVSAPPYHNRRAGWGRGATSFSTQSLYERGRSRSPMPRSSSMFNETHALGRDSHVPSEEAMHSWLFSDPLYYRPHNLHGFSQSAKEDYFDGTWGSMDKLNRRVKQKKEKGKLETYQQPKLHRSLDDLKSEKKPEFLHSQEIMLLQTVKEAERCGFSIEDLHVAYLHCGKENPVYWLEDNWPTMVKNVIALAAKYGEDNEENDVGVISPSEAKEALRIHRGDIWDAVTECIENRQRKILELTVRGNFTQKQIADALKNNEGNVELAYADLLRASSRRHKFILSPGFSEDSEDLNVYAQTDESVPEHTASASPMKAGRLDTPTESKTDKKKSDFLTKLSAIRKAQSERRKAREEKELIRESIVQDFPVSAEQETAAGKSSYEESKKILHQESVEALDNVEERHAVENLEHNKSSAEVVTKQKEGTEDNIPEDFDNNWVPTQGEWIEEFSDEQWDESDGQWVTLEKKYHKLEKELEDEAMQMAALWEKEELEDDVFEEEPKEISLKQPTELEKLQIERDEKFENWVKVNLEKSLSEPEEDQMNEQGLDVEAMTEEILRDSEYEEHMSQSPLHHYPAVLDLSIKPQLEESDWAHLQTNAEPIPYDERIEGDEELRKLEEVQELPNGVQEATETTYGQEGSDGEWERIEYEQLQEFTELEKSVSYAEEESELLSEQLPQEEFSLERDLRSLVKEEFEMRDDVHAEPEVIDIPRKYEEPVLPASSFTDFEVEQKEAAPKPPVRRKSKLNAAAIEQALKMQPDVEKDQPPPALPLKAKIREAAPAKPPRLTPPLTSSQNIHKDTSPVGSFSYESDSNCFADSESETEIKIARQKSMHKKPMKYENEDVFNQEDVVRSVKPVSKVAEDLELEPEILDDIDITADKPPLPVMKDINFDPELPIPIGSRGSKLPDDVSSPKAFREDTTRPLQLFKAVKHETPVPLSVGDNYKHPEQNMCLDHPEASSSMAIHPEKIEVSTIQPESNLMQTAEMTKNSMHRATDTVIQSTQENLSNFVSEEEMNKKDTLDTEDITFTEMEGMSAAVDYFFGRYNEVTVTRPKKKAPVIRGNKPSAISSPKLMSKSEIVASSDSKKDSQMDKSLVLTTPASSESKDNITEIQKNEENVQKLSSMPVHAEPIPPPASCVPSEPIPAPTAPTECLSFAEDYFFGSYNEVVVQKKGKKKPGLFTPKPKPLILPFVADQNVVDQSNELEPVPLSVQQVAGEKDVNAPSFYSESHDGSTNTTECTTAQEVPEKVENIPVSTITSSIQQNNLQTFDTQYPMTEAEKHAFYYQNLKQSPEEAIPDNTKISKVKSVHFEEPEVPVAPPPRKHRLQGDAKVGTNTSNISSSKSIADEYLFGQYDEVLKDKKKLPPSSEDFKMKQGCDPPNFPSENPLQPDENQDTTISSEISVEKLEETLNLQKSTSNDVKLELSGSQTYFNVTDDTLTEYPDTKSVLSDTAVAESDSSKDVESVPVIADEVTDTEISSEARKCVGISFTDEPMTESTAFLENTLSTEKSDSVETPTNNKNQSEQNFEMHQISHEGQYMYPHVQSSQSQLIHDEQYYENEQLVVGQIGSIADDSYPLYYIQDSFEHLDGELKIIKSSVELEGTDDSEQEWKLNEERKNSLNAAFIKNNAEPNSVCKEIICSNDRNDFVLEQEVEVAENSFDVKFDLHIMSDNVEQQAEISEKETEIQQMIAEIADDIHCLENISETNQVPTLYSLCSEAISSSEISLDRQSETIDSKVDNAIVDKNIGVSSEISYGVQPEFDTDNICSDLPISTIHPPQTSISSVTDDQNLEEASLEQTSLPEVPAQESTVESHLSDLTSQISVSISLPSNRYQKSQELSLEDSQMGSECLDDEMLPNAYLQDTSKELECHIGTSDSVDLEDTSDANDFSDDDMPGSTHSSVSTQIAVSFKAEIKDLVDADEASTFHGPVETCDVSSSVVEEFELNSGKQTEVQEQLQTTEIRLESEVPVKVECETKLMSVNEDLVQSEILDHDTSEVVKCSEVQEQETQETILNAEFAGTEEVKLISSGITSNVLDVESSLDLQNKGNKDNDVLLEEDKNEVLDSTEEQCSSLMSHFYDEWFENVQAAKQLGTSYDIRKFYESYSSESSGSANVSDNEDFTQEVNSEGAVVEVIAADTKDVLKDKTVEEQVYEETCMEIADKTFVQTSNLVMNEEPLTDKSIKNASYQLTSEAAAQESASCFKTCEDETVSGFVTEVVINTEKSVENSKSQLVNHDIVNKFSTSKSCQTDESLEEEVFFDSFDDSFTIPSFMNIPIDQDASATKPVTFEMGIQCNIIGSEDISVPPQNLENFESQSVNSSNVQPVQEKTDSLIRSKKVKDMLEKKTSLKITENEDSSCESFEDSDSDIFIDSHSSHDELESNVKNTHSKLYSDSDTGFSSGSDSGRIKKIEGKQKKGIKELAPVHEKSSVSEILKISESPTSTQMEQIPSVFSVTDLPVKAQGSQSLELSKITETITCDLPKDISHKGVENLIDIKEHKLESVSQILTRSESTLKHKIESLSSNVLQNIPLSLKQSSTEDDSKFVDVEDSVPEYFADETKSESLASAVMHSGKQISLDDDSKFVDVEDNVPEYFSDEIKSETVKSDIMCSVKQVLLDDDSKFVDVEDSVPEYFTDETKSEKIVFLNVEQKESISVIDEQSAQNLFVDNKEFEHVQYFTEMSENENEHKLSPEAIVPIMIEQTPLEDVKFVDIEDEPTEAAVDDTESEKILLPTVEYFYGPLPQSITIEPPPDLNHRYFDTLSSFPEDHAKLSEAKDFQVQAAIDDVRKQFQEGKKHSVDDSLSLDEDNFIDTVSSLSSLNHISEHISKPNANNLTLKQESDETAVNVFSDEAFKVPETLSSQILINRIQTTDSNAPTKFTKPELESSMQLSDELKVTEMMCESLEVTDQVAVLSSEQECENVVIAEDSGHVKVKKKSENDESLYSEAVSEYFLTSETNVSTKNSVPESSAETEVLMEHNLLEKPNESSKNTSASEIPHVPSDIVRYLYYDDSVTFDESLSAQTCNENEDIHLDKMVDSDKISGICKDDSTKQMEEKCELIIDRSESITQWFEPEQDKSHVHQQELEKFEDAECHSNTKSSISKDEDLPCIPEVILESRDKEIVQEVKVDSDEITDISTHFTMTEDSDKFSDIEEMDSENSLESFEEECSKESDGYDKKVISKKKQTSSYDQEIAGKTETHPEDLKLITKDENGNIAEIVNLSCESCLPFTGGDHESDIMSVNTSEIKVESAESVDTNLNIACQEEDSVSFYHSPESISLMKVEGDDDKSEYIELGEGDVFEEINASIQTTRKCSKEKTEDATILSNNDIQTPQEYGFLESATASIHCVESPKTVAGISAVLGHDEESVSYYQVPEAQNYSESEEKRSSLDESKYNLAEDIVTDVNLKTESTIPVREVKEISDSESFATLSSGKVDRSLEESDKLENIVLSTKQEFPKALYQEFEELPQVTERKLDEGEKSKGFSVEENLSENNNNFIQSNASVLFGDSKGKVSENENRPSPESSIVSFHVNDESAALPASDEFLKVSASNLSETVAEHSSEIQSAPENKSKIQKIIYKTAETCIGAVYEVGKELFSDVAAKLQDITSSYLQSDADTARSSSEYSTDQTAERSYYFVHETEPSNLLQSERIHIEECDILESEYIEIIENQGCTISVFEPETPQEEKNVFLSREEPSKSDYEFEEISLSTTDSVSQPSTNISQKDDGAFAKQESNVDFKFDSVEKNVFPEDEFIKKEAMSKKHHTSDAYIAAKEKDIEDYVKRAYEEEEIIEKVCSVDISKVKTTSCDSSEASVFLSAHSALETSDSFNTTSDVSCSDNTSLQFHSLSDNVDDTLNISSDDFTDVPSHFTLTEDSDTWSDVDVDLSVDLELNEETNFENNRFQSRGRLESEKTTSEQATGDSEKLLQEHFATITSLNEQLSVVDSMNLADVQTAISKVHEETSTQSQTYEKAEGSDNWLEAATDHSLSEFEEDVLSEPDDKNVAKFSLETSTDEYTKEKEHSTASFQNSEEQLGHAMEKSPSFDQDSSDHVSDTCADISLQGITSESSSDKWSDIEAEALIDDALYSGLETNGRERICFSLPRDDSFEKSSDVKSDLIEVKVSVQCVTSQESVSSESSNVSNQGVEEIQLLQTMSGVKDISCKDIKTDEISELQDVPKSVEIEKITSVQSLQTSALLTTPSTNISGLSDDEFTNVTPLDVTTEESDKWSDVSDATSVEEIDVDSTLMSLKAESQVHEVIQLTETEITSKECFTKSADEGRITEGSIKEATEPAECTLPYGKIPSLESKIDSVSGKESERSENHIESVAIVSTSSESNKSASEPVPSVMLFGNVEPTSEKMNLFSCEEMKQKTDKEDSMLPCSVIDTSQPKTHEIPKDIQENLIHSERESTSLKTSAAEKHGSDEILDRHLYKFEREDEAKKEEDVLPPLLKTMVNEPIGDYTDVLSHTVKSDLSEQWCSLATDTSVTLDGKGSDALKDADIGQAHDNIHPDLPDTAFIEETDQSLDSRKFAEKVGVGYSSDIQYSESYHIENQRFEISDDELIYPLPYDDWIEESFDLKEYGIETALSEYGSDIHGSGLVNDDDEDIQRAIDFNLSNYEADNRREELEEALNTESFKTFSNDISPSKKISEKEYDTWSTADAPSIEDDFPEEDIVLSKIDKLLAEDFTFGSLDEYETLESDVHFEVQADYSDGINEKYDSEQSENLKSSKIRYEKTSIIEEEEHKCTISKDVDESKHDKSFEDVYDKDGAIVQVTALKSSIVEEKVDMPSSVPPDKTAEDMSLEFSSSHVQAAKAETLTKWEHGKEASNVLVESRDEEDLHDKNDARSHISFQSHSVSLPGREVTHSSDIPVITEVSKTEKQADTYFTDKHFVSLPKETENVTVLTDSPSSEVPTNDDLHKPDIPAKRSRSALKSEDDVLAFNVGEVSSDKVAASDIKPDIPLKEKRKGASKKDCENYDLAAGKPALPPKKEKRSLSASSESLSLSASLSSSAESLPSFESTSSKDYNKMDRDFTSITPSDVCPEVPARKSKSPVLPPKSRTVCESDKSEGSSASSSVRSRRSSKSIDLAKEAALGQKRPSIDERILKLQNEGKCTDRDKAFIAAKLIEMQFEEKDALLAAKQCNSVYHAVKFLTQLCELCNCRFPINLMASMVHCTHRACKECLKAHFTSLIYDRSVFSLLCPVCHKPDITDQNIQEYFNHLDLMLRNILDDDVYDLFQRKLRDEVLTKDPNFHWCSQCSSGFIASPRLKKLYCPDCSAITCAMCHQTWELEHEGVHCERFQQWKDMHTPEPPPAGLVKYLTERGITCPSCGINYAQACAGCMMYKCSHCSFEFCGFCSRPCKKGKECSDEVCESRGHHMHHPYNCLFFLRDKDMAELQLLLEEESVTYATLPAKDQIVKTRCQVREQKQVHGALVEDRCGRSIEPYCAGLCSTHYMEYLAELIRRNKLDVLSIMTIQDLQFMLRKSRVFVPERMKGESSEEYYDRLLKLVNTVLS